MRAGLDQPAARACLYPPAVELTPYPAFVRVHPGGRLRDVPDRAVNRRQAVAYTQSRKQTLIKENRWRCRLLCIAWVTARLRSASCNVIEAKTSGEIL
ncbi:MAG: hypothetical protein KTR25_02870 [Myxococcales bacterium]|nr:hypothetical protein [Myxococcales bacterium]